MRLLNLCRRSTVPLRSAQSGTATFDDQVCLYESAQGCVGNLDFVQIGAAPSTTATKV